MPRDKPRVRLTIRDQAAAPALAGLMDEQQRDLNFAETTRSQNVEYVAQADKIGWRCPLRNTRRQHAHEKTIGLEQGIAMAKVNNKQHGYMVDKAYADDGFSTFVA